MTKLKALVAIAILAGLVFPLPWNGYPCHVNQNQTHCQEQ